MSALANQIIAAVTAATSPDHAVSTQGLHQMMQLQSDPQAFFSASLEVVVSPSASIANRRMVGIQLKNLMKRFPQVAQNAAAQEALCTQVVVDPHVEIRKVGCSIISLAVREEVWPATPVLQSLVGVLQQKTNDLNAQHGIMRALAEITADAIANLDVNQVTHHVVNAAAPYLTQNLGDSPEALQVRENAFEVIMAVLENAGEAVDNPQQCYSHYVMQSGIVQVIEACFLNLQQPVSKSISVTCVKVLTLSLIFYDAIDNNLFNRMADLMSQVLASSDDHSGRDEELRMAATDFFTVAPNIPKFYSLALTAVLKVIPIVIRSMVLSDMEMAGLQANKEDWQVPDKEEDIRPRHYGARQQQMHDDGEDEDDDGEVENNTLRSTSGSMLDTLSSCYGEAVLMPVLQEVDKMMQPNAPWREFEASMVAFGAVVDGCLEALTPYLPSITTRLLGVLEDPNSHFLVVSICLWACSKISSFILTDETMTRRFLVNGILAKMQSPSKYTQSYATDALQTFLQANQDVGANLGPYLGTILETWAQCLRGYQLKNKVSLLDALDIICTDLGEQIKQDSNMSQALLAAMGELWTATDNESMFIFPLFSSMSRVCAALGPHVESMVQVILTRGLEVLQSNLTERQQALASDGDPPEEEFITTSCDLICGVFEAMGSAMAPFVEGNTVLTQMMLFMLQDPSAEIRCSGFGLASEMCKSSPTVIQQVLPDFMQAVLSNLSNIDESTYYVASNVAWALCQLVQNQMDINNLPTFQSIPQGVQAFAALVRILTSDGVSADMRNMAENICFFIGIAVYTVGPELAEQAQCPPSAFAGRFLEYMRNVKEMECREEAVNGFLLLARQDPSCVVPHLSLFFDLACTLGGADAETKRTVKDIFQEVRSKQPQAWQQLSGYSAPGKKKLYEIFGVQS